MTTRFFTFLTVWVLSLTHSFSADIDVNKQYYIFHASGCVIGGSKSIPVLEDFQSDSNQKFKFVKTGNYYTIRNNEYATNIAKTGSWNTEYNSTTANVAQFSIEDGGGEFIKLKCRDNNLYLGTDNTTVGSNIYSDKNGNELLHY